MEICRACMTGNDLLKVNETYLENYNLLTDLSVSLWDSLPQFMCKVCWETVEAFIKFRNDCINTERYLYSRYEPVVKTEVGVGDPDEEFVIRAPDEDTKEVEVKIEFKDDGDVDALIDDVINDSNTEVLVKKEERADLPLPSKKDLQNGRPKRKYTKRKASIPVAIPVPKQPKQSKKSIKKIKAETGSKEADAFKIKEPKKNEAKQPSTNNVKAPELLPCGLCNNNYESKESLYLHLESHKETLKCSICLLKFKTWQWLLSHRFGHIDSKQWRCHLCWRWFYKEAHAEYHYYKRHGDMKEFPGVQCRQCPKLFKTLRGLKAHMHGVHFGNKFICDYCSKVVHTKQSLKQHMRTHMPARPYVCKICDLSFKFTAGLRVHQLRKHSSNSVRCERCRRHFADRSKCDRHTCAAPSVCPVCGKSCDNSDVYREHLRTHNSSSAHPCRRCPAAFKTASALRAHADRHDGYRRHRCTWAGCPLAFYTPSSLHKHRRVHTGEKPYVCTVCTKAFSGSNNLKVHMKVHGLHLVKKRSDTSEDIGNTFRFC